MFFSLLILQASQFSLLNGFDFILNGFKWDWSFMISQHNHVWFFKYIFLVYIGLTVVANLLSLIFLPFGVILPCFPWWFCFYVIRMLHAISLIFLSSFFFNGIDSYQYKCAWFWLGITRIFWMLSHNTVIFHYIQYTVFNILYILYPDQIVIIFVCSGTVWYVLTPTLLASIYYQVLQLQFPVGWLLSINLKLLF